MLDLFKLLISLGLILLGTFFMLGSLFAPFKASIRLGLIGLFMIILGFVILAL